MRDSILNRKAILLVDDEPDILEVLKEEILFNAPNCTLDTATWENNLLSWYTMANSKGDKGRAPSTSTFHLNLK